MLASDHQPRYKIALFCTSLPSCSRSGRLGYALFFSVRAQFPKATPAFWPACRSATATSSTPDGILLLAGIYLLADGPWDNRVTSSSASDSWR